MGTIAIVKMMSVVDLLGLLCPIDNVTNWHTGHYISRDDSSLHPCLYFIASVAYFLSLSTDKNYLNRELV